MSVHLLIFLGALLFEMLVRAPVAPSFDISLLNITYSPLLAHKQEHVVYSYLS